MPLVAMLPDSGSSSLQFVLDVPGPSDEEVPGGRAILRVLSLSTPFACFSP